jgi:hypothetical protein
MKHPLTIAMAAGVATLLVWGSAGLANGPMPSGGGGHSPGGQGGGFPSGGFSFPGSGHSNPGSGYPSGPPTDASPPPDYSQPPAAPDPAAAAPPAPDAPAPPPAPPPAAAAPAGDSGADAPASAAATPITTFDGGDDGEGGHDIVQVLPGGKLQRLHADGTPYPTGPTTLLQGIAASIKGIFTPERIDPGAGVPPNAVFSIVRPPAE